MAALACQLRTASGKPRIESRQIGKAQLRGREPTAYDADLVFDLALLPPGGPGYGPTGVQSGSGVLVHLRIFGPKTTVSSSKTAILKSSTLVISMTYNQRRSRLLSSAGAGESPNPQMHQNPTHYWIAQADTSLVRPRT